MADQSNDNDKAISTPKSKQLVWLITGTSSGLGLALVQHILSFTRDLVIATARARSIHLLDPLLVNPAFKGRLQALPLDVTADEETIGQVVRDAVGLWERIDVVVNNAG